MAHELLELLTISIDQVQSLRNDIQVDLHELDRRLRQIRDTIGEALDQQTPQDEHPNTV